MFSILSSAHARTGVILAGKCDSHRHSTTGFSENVEVAETSYRKIPKISPGAYIWRRGLSTEGNLRFKIDWRLVFGRAI